MNKHLTKFLPLILIVMAFIFLGSYYSITTPLWEAPDEPGHFHYIRHLIDHKELPRSQGNITLLWYHPPLYYLISAVVVSPIEMSPYINWRRPNPKSSIVNPTNSGKARNIQLHSIQELWPYRDIALVVHIARLVNVLFGAITVAATYLLAQKIFPKTKWLAITAACIVAFNPEFLFISGSLSNDIALSAAFAVALLPATNILQGDHRPRQFLWLGTQIGLAILFKQNGVILLAIAGLVILWIAWQSKTGQKLINWSALVGVPALILAGPFHIRNLILYGDLFAYQAYKADHPPSNPKPMWDIISDPKFYNRIHETFWGYFGWLNLSFADWVYTTLLFIYPLVILGLIIWFWQTREKAEDKNKTNWIKAEGGTIPVILLLICTLIAWIFPIQHTMTFGAFGVQGRYLFQIISAQSIIISLGLFSLPLGKLRPLFVSIVPVGLLALAIWAPIGIIGPTYHYLGDSPQVLNTLPFKRTDVFAEAIQLAGYKTTLNQQNNQLQVAFYWQTLAVPAQDYTIFAQLIDAEGNKVGQDDRRPLDGDFPTNLWRPDDVLHTNHTLTFNPTCLQTPCYLLVGFYNWQTGERLPVTQGNSFGDAVKIDTFLPFE